MTTFQFTLKNNPKVNGEKSIIITFIKDRKNTSLSIRKSCKEEQWSYETERVKKNHPEHKKLNTFIEKYKKIIQDIIEDFEDRNIPYSLPDLIESIKKYKGKNKTASFTEYLLQSINNQKVSGKIGSARIEKDTLNSLQKFFNKKEIGFNEITFLSLKKYEFYCYEKGNSPTTIAIRMRTMRYIFNQAITSKIIKEAQYPFKDYKISKIKTDAKKEFLDEDEIQALKNYVPKDNREAFAKDMFLFSYYSRGINFIDLLKLKKNALSSENLTFIRTKTNVPVTFKLAGYNKDIMKKYLSDDSSEYLFNIVQNNNADITYLKNKSHKYLNKYINPSLKVIIQNLGINKHITYYCARHSFATALKFKNISVDIIRQALGQKDINSTMAYLNSLPDKKLDEIIDMALI